ncbi:unnamed protein product [Symbiodinium necroappetens]|uniref:Pentatricopeptide repeat-containing protein n=1 Tax=Symbiodinium necroappetens TaxID=1628268 RepID=A0A813CKJ1_9DINO|nr:unnamed protein product [Symbiodinium necroappetens]
MYLLDGMLSKHLQPSIVTFANLVGAHSHAPLDQLEGVLSSMTHKGVGPNQVFTEAVLSALFPGRFTAAWTVDDICTRLKGASRNRLRVAKSVLKDARSRGVRLTQLSSMVDQCLQQLTI